jgi:hypothetical protein
MVKLEVGKHGRREKTINPLNGEKPSNSPGESRKNWIIWEKIGAIGI